MRGRFRRLVTLSLVRVGSSQPLLFLASSVLGALLAVLVRAYEVVRRVLNSIFSQTLARAQFAVQNHANYLTLKKYPGVA